MRLFLKLFGLHQSVRRVTPFTILSLRYSADLGRSRLVLSGKRLIAPKNPKRDALKLQNLAEHLSKT